MASCPPPPFFSLCGQLAAWSDSILCRLRRKWQYTHFTATVGQIPRELHMHIISMAKFDVELPGKMAPKSTAARL